MRAIIIYVRIFHPTLIFNELETQIGVLAPTASAIFRTAKARANCDNFHEILACCTSITDANSGRNGGRLPLVVDGTEDSAKVRDAIMAQPYLSFHEAVFKWPVQLQRTSQKITAMRLIRTQFIFLRINCLIMLSLWIFV